MKICKIYIGDYKQFKRLELDFTHPDTGEPLDKICFIGRNGTGKSNLLELIDEGALLLNHPFLFRTPLIFKIKDSGKNYLIANFKVNNFGEVEVLQMPSEIEADFVKCYFDSLPQVAGDSMNTKSPIKSFFQERGGLQYLLDVQSKTTVLQTIYGADNKFDDKVIVKVKPEGQGSSYSQIYDVPETTLNDALDLFANRSSYHIVSPDYVSEFWKQLNYLIKKREDDRNQFEELPENLSKTKSELIEQFRKDNPEILQKLAELWNKILESADLEFDYKRAKNPVQLTDNLKAYIIHKKTGKIVRYSELSTGIRNFIFKIGHIYSLYFNRKIDQGFLLVDEPENSLFPDFLYDLIDIYKEITTDKDGNNNTQMFFATHSPIIAAQFEPYERVILEWNDEGTISAHRGVAPVGDDPNDVLEKDFEIRSLMGKEGQKVWEDYLALKKQLRRTSDPKQKDELVDKIAKIGHDYNFEE